MPTAASRTSQFATVRTGRMSSGPATTRTATTNASRSSGKPHRDHRCGSTGSQSLSTRRPRRLASPTTTITATARSRTSAQRRRNSESATIPHARTNALRRATRQSAGAHPSTVTSACSTSSSSADADSAMTAPRPTTNAPTARSTPSIVRRFLRPGSAAYSNVRLNERSADTGSPRSVATRHHNRGTDASTPCTHATLDRPKTSSHRPLRCSQASS